jgi:hypothetical protein
VTDSDTDTIDLPDLPPIEIPTSHPRHLGKRLGGTLLFVLGWCTITGVATYFIVGGMLQQMWAADYHETTGTVISSRVQANHGSDSTTYSPELEYRYVVDRQTYTGHRYAYSTGGSSDSGYARRIVDRYPASKTITVYYDSDDPSEAVLTRDVQNESYFFLLFLQPFWLVGLGGAAYLLILPWLHAKEQAFFQAETLRPGLTIPTWGTVTMQYDGLIVRRRSRIIRAIREGILTYGLLTFLALFVVGFGFGFGTAEPHVVFWAMRIAAAGAGLALLAGLIKPSRAAVTLDVDGRAIHLRTKRRDETLPFDAITQWIVRRVDQMGGGRGNGQGWKYFVIAARTNDGREVPVHAFETKVGYQTSETMLPLCGKVQQLFARLTDSEACPTLVADGLDDIDAPESVGDAVALVGKAFSAARNDPYRDLT